MKTSAFASFGLAALFVSHTAFAHRVYFEPQAKAAHPWQSPASEDYSFDNPAVLDNIWGSKALFGYLTPGDVDVYQFSVLPSDPFFFKTLIAMPLSPACNETKNSYINVAVVGPGLPAPIMSLPFDVPPGYGVIVKENPVLEDGVQREVFYESTSNISWFLPDGMSQACIEDRSGPPMATCDMSNIFAQPFFTPYAPHYIVVWANTSRKQDYTLSVGVVDSGYYYPTPDEPLTVNNAHLHTPCTPPYPGE